MSFHGLIALFILAMTYSIVWMGHSSFIHSPTAEHLGCFQVLAIMNTDAMIYPCAGFGGPKFSTHLANY